MLYPISTLLSGAALAVSGFGWQAQSASRSWSLTQTDNNFRFEIRTGDRCASIKDDETRERSELYCGTHLPVGKLLVAEFDWLLEPGPVTDRRWLIPFQLHGDDSVSPASPVFALGIAPTADRTGEQIIVTGDSIVGDAHSWRSFGVVAPFSRGVMRHVKCCYVDGQGQATGAVHVEIDGVVVLDRSGIVTGFDRAKVGPYAKVGCYAGVATQATDKGLVTHIQNLSLIQG